MLAATLFLPPPAPVTAQIGQGQVPTVSPKAGQAFPWEMGIPVSPYSMVNLYNGNLLTTIPIAAWKCEGPAVNVSLHHNSSTQGIAAPPGAGFSFGTGWSISYGGRIIDQTTANPPKVHLVEDDGLLKTYTWNASTQTATPPVGVYDKLEKSGAEWVVTRKNQWRRVYDASGLLLREHDSNIQPNVQFDLLTEIYRRTGGDEIETVNGPMNKVVTFAYGTNPDTGPISATTLLGQVNFHYNATTSKFERVEMTFESASISFVTNAQGRITSLTDKNNATWEFDYDSNGRLWHVTDPNQNIQSFTYSLATPHTYRTSLLDARAKLWKFDFKTWGGLESIINPLSQSKTFQYDAARNRTLFTNEVGKSWTSTYDAVGNLTSMTNPLGQKSQLTYDAWNNLTSVTPPLDNNGGLDTNRTVTIEYEDYSDPNTQTYADRTHPTTIVEPADGNGNPQAITTLTWWHDYHPGEIQSVTDDNGVETFFKGSRCSSLTRREGPSPAVGAGLAVVNESFSYDYASRLIACSGPSGSATCDYDGAGDQPASVIV